VRWIAEAVVPAEKLRYNHSHEEPSEPPVFLCLFPLSCSLFRPLRRQSDGNKDESDAEKLSGDQESHGGSS